MNMTMLWIVKILDTCGLKQIVKVTKAQKEMNLLKNSTTTITVMMKTVVMNVGWMNGTMTTMEITKRVTAMITQIAP